MAIYVVSFVLNGERVASIPERLTLSRAENLAGALTTLARCSRIGYATARDCMGQLGVSFDYAIVD